MEDKIMLNLMPIRRSRFLPDTLDTLFEEPWFRHFGEPGTTRQAWNPPVEVIETNDAITFTVEVPGLEEKDVAIEVDKGVLTFSGERARQERAEGDYVRSERWYGKFSRSFSLPDAADAQRISATMKNGLLLITVPKREEAKPRKVEVQIA
jgi:HSP20 family protein